MVRSVFGRQSLAKMAFIFAFGLLVMFAPDLSAQDITVGVNWYSRDLDNLDAYPCMRMVIGKVTGVTPASTAIKDLLQSNLPGFGTDPNSAMNAFTEVFEYYGVGVYIGLAWSPGFVDQLKSNLEAGMPAVLCTNVPVPGRQFVVNGYETQNGET